MNKQNSLDVYIKLRFFSALFFSTIITVNLVYQATVVGLNPLQLVLVGTLLEAVCFVCEIPTGIVADLYSRKASVVIGIFLMGLGFVFEGAFPTFFAVLIAQIIWGIGATFISGAREAWIADEIGEQKTGKAFMKGQKANQAGMFLGIVLSMVLANTNIRLPIIIGGILYCLLSFSLALFMPEHNFKPTPVKRRETFGAMKRTFFRGMKTVRTNKALLLMIIVGTIFGMFSEGFDRLWTPFLIDNYPLPAIGNLKPVVWFGVISMAATVMATIMIGIIDRNTDANDRKSIVHSLILANLFLPVLVIVFALSGSFLFAASAYCFSFMFKEAIGPLSDSWINHNLEPGLRATIFSLYSQMNSFGQIVGGPILGIIATVISIKVGIIVAGLILAPAAFIYLRILKEDRLKEMKV